MFAKARQSGTADSTIVIQWIERFLWTLGGLALFYSSAGWGLGLYGQFEGARTLQGLLQSSAGLAQGSPSPKAVAAGDVFGSIEIPRLQLSAVIFEGISNFTLVEGVGHLPRSPRPEERGNVVLAAHRDTFFRRLKNIVPGDSIALITPAGQFRYIVRSTEVVKPDAGEILESPPDVGLTLITCYPFRFVGRAPERFVVRARRTE